MDATAAKRRTQEILEVSKPGDAASRRFDYFIGTLILLNVAAVILETVGDLHADYDDAFRAFEFVSVALFTIEYVLRLWSSTAIPGYEGPVAGRLRYALTPMLLIDLAAILPAYLGLFFVLDLRFVRVLRLLRLVKLTRHSRALQVLASVFRQKSSDLLLALFVFLVTLVFVSSAMYFLETEAQPDRFGSIPQAMWWGIVTLATVGYGDVVPVTAWGRAVGAAFILLGIMVIALPVAIFASGYAEALKREHEGGVAKCPHCGKAP